MKKAWQPLFLAFLVGATILIIRQQRNMPFQHNKGMVFGTFYNVTYQNDSDLKEEIENELKKVDNALSMFNPTSVISRINNGAVNIDDSEEGRMFIEVCQLAQHISEETHGAFDMTVAPLVNLWGFGFRNNESPSAHAIDSIRQFTGYQLIHLDTKKKTLTKRDSRTMLDCSAIAKGYGCDVVARLLQAHDIKNFMIEIGGEVVTKGINEKRMPWRIGVVKPTEDSLDTAHEVMDVLNVTDKAMATSGNYRNFYYKNGKRYAHTIDPHTGKPVQHSILSATVIADRCSTADAYATAFMVMDIDGAKRVLEKHTELMAYLICSAADGTYTVWTSPSMDGKILDKNH